MATKLYRRTSVSGETDALTDCLLPYQPCLHYVLVFFSDEIYGHFISAKMQSNTVESLNAHAGLNSKREVLQGLSQPGLMAAMANTWDVALCLVQG